MKLAILVLLFLAPSLRAQQPDRCPMHLAMNARGHLSQRGLAISRKTLLTDLQNGCKATGPISSITLKTSPRVTYGKVSDLIAFLHDNAPDVPFKLLTPKP